MADSNYPSVTALVPGIGSNGSTTFTNYGPTPVAITVTPSGNAQITTTNTKFYGSCMLFDGNGDFLTMPASAINPSAGTFTLRAWVRFSSGTRPDEEQTLFSKWVSTAGANQSFLLYFTAASTSDAPNGIAFDWRSGTSTYVSKTWSHTFAFDTWYHIQLCGDGTNLYAFVDGTLKSAQAIGASAINASASTAVDIARTNSAVPFYFSGRITDAEILPGVCRNTTTFTAPLQLAPLLSGNAAISGAAAYQVRARSISTSVVRSQWTATPDGAGDYSVYVPDIRLEVICHHDDPAGTVTDEPECAVVTDATQALNFAGLDYDAGYAVGYAEGEAAGGGGGNSGGLTSITLSAI